MSTLYRHLLRLALLLVTSLAIGAPAADKPIQLAAADKSVFLSSPDALIAKTLQDIRTNRLDDALKEVDRVISIRPDFKLAHLIRGDLLMARVKPLLGMGDVASPPAQNIADLRDEARVRLLGTIEQPDPSFLPRQILQLAPEQKYALLADASRARLYLFENVDGEPRLKRDFYMTIGKNGTDKRTEGDKKTPVGVYHIADRLPRRQLADLYGDGAFPLNYPNAWDLAHGRSGHGIWLHGVPSDTYSRPPRSSDGCVVVANPDLEELSKWVQVGVTPIVIVDRADWVDRATWEKTRDDLLAQLASWRQDWEAKAADDFLGHYSTAFLQGSGRAWAEAKRRNIVGKDWIHVEIRDASLFLYPDGDLAYTDFTQHYSSDKLVSTAHKEMYWHRDDGHWRIVMENATELPGTALAQR